MQLYPCIRRIPQLKFYLIQWEGEKQSKQNIICYGDQNRRENSRQNIINHNLIKMMHSLDKLIIRIIYKYIVILKYNRVYFHRHIFIVLYITLFCLTFQDIFLAKLSHAMGCFAGIQGSLDRAFQFSLKSLDLIEPKKNFRLNYLSLF